MSLTKAGPELKVNIERRFHSEKEPSIANLKDGGFAVAWQSNTSRLPKIYSRRFDRDGNPVGEELEISQSGGNPSVTGLDDGGFVVTYAQNRTSQVAGGIYGQRFDSEGNKKGKGFLVTDYQNGVPGDPVIATLNNGGIVIIYERGDIYAQILDSNGNKVGEEFLVNPLLFENRPGFGRVRYGGHQRPSVTALNNGGFVVTWDWFAERGQIRSMKERIYGQTFDNDGDRQGNAFVISSNSKEVIKEVNSSVAALKDGGFVVTWDLDVGEWRNTRPRSIKGDKNIHGQRFDSSGKEVGDEFVVNTYTDMSQYWSSAAPTEDGGFVVVWSSSHRDGLKRGGIYGQRFDNNGEKLGEEFPVNTTPHSTRNAVTTPLSDGEFAVAWESNDIYVQRFADDIDLANKVSVSEASVVEGDAGTTDANFSVNLNVPSDRTIKVGYNTNPNIDKATVFRPDEAKAGQDYEATSGVLTFNPGETTKTVAVPIIGDTAEELDEFFHFYLVEPNKPTPIAPDTVLASAKATIINDDAANTPPTLTDINLNTREDRTRNLGRRHFNKSFSDPDRDRLQTVKITALPSNGELKLKNQPVAANQEIAIADTNKLQYIPNPDFHGNDNFQWNGSDGTDYAETPATVNLNIKPVSDRPIVTLNNTDIEVKAGTGEQTLPAFASFNPGVGEDSQTLERYRVKVGKKDRELFSAQPTLDSDGNLKFTPVEQLDAKVGITDTAQIRVLAFDSGKSPGQNRSIPKAFSIQVKPGENNDNLKGTRKDDTIDGDGGNDDILGFGGSDLLIGGDGNDTLSGANNNDTLDGGLGNDELIGGKGDDSLLGGDGSDRLNGVGGNDTLIGGGGDDVVLGAGGADIIVLTPDWGNDILHKFQDDIDKIQLPEGVGFSDLTVTQDGPHTLISYGDNSLSMRRLKMDLIDETDFVV